MRQQTRTRRKSQEQHREEAIDLVSPAIHIENAHADRRNRVQTQIDSSRSEGNSPPSDSMTPLVLPHAEGTGPI